MWVHHIAWIPPTDDSWKLNFAGCIGPDRGGSGCVLRDQNGVFKVAFAEPSQDCKDLLMAELIALHQGLLIAIEYGVDYIEIEGDQAPVIQMLASLQAIPISEVHKSILTDCLDCIKAFRSVKVRQIYEYSNDAANNIARLATRLQEPSHWICCPPPEIANILVNDVIGRWISFTS